MKFLILGGALMKSGNNSFGQRAEFNILKKVSEPVVIELYFPAVSTLKKSFFSFS